MIILIVYFEYMIGSFSFALTGKCNSMVELFTSTGREFDSTIKLSASTGKEYCESTDKCNSKVKLFTSTGRDLDYIREYLPALVHNQRISINAFYFYSFSILFCDVTIHGFRPQLYGLGHPRQPSPPRQLYRAFICENVVSAGRVKLVPA